MEVAGTERLAVHSVGDAVRANWPSGWRGCSESTQSGNHVLTITVF